MTRLNSTSTLGRIGLVDRSIDRLDSIHSAGKNIRHKAKVQNRLRQIGVSKYGLLRAESRYLHRIIHSDENIMAVVYGHNVEGTAMLIATDSRLIYLDKKPLFVKSDELTYDIVSGVSYSHVSIFTTVTLHTRMGDYVLRTMNPKCVSLFVNYIESHCLQHERASMYKPIDKLLW